MKVCRIAYVIVCAAICVARTATLHAQADGDDFVQTIVSLLRDPDKDIRALALDQIRTEVPGEAATRAFAAELPKLPADGQAALIRALADRGDVAAREAVLERLDAHGEESVQVAALQAFGALGQPADVPRLVAALAAGSPAAQAAARQSLARLPGDATVEAIAAELDRAPPELRVALIKLLRERRGTAAVPRLLVAAVADNPQVRTAAMAVLGELASPEHIPAMVSAVLKAPPGTERDAAERAVAAVSRRIAEPDERARPLLTAMQELPAEDRTALLSTLGRIGGAPALEAIQPRLADADFNQHEIGLRALCNWPDASVAPQLKHLAGADEHPAHQRLALRALIRIAPLDDGRSDAERLALLKEVLELATREDDRQLVLQRASAIRTLETLRFVVPFLDQPAYAQQAAATIVELAHDRRLREPNKAEFHAALDRVIAISNDPVVIERAQRYQKGQTWARPKAA